MTDPSSPAHADPAEAPDAPPASPASPASPATDDADAPDGMLVLGGPSGADDAPAGAPATAVPCAECGEGEYDADGYCGQCGARAADPRDHEEYAPSSWVAGVCDRGIRHESNEDALAVAADETGRSATIVVCDGVSTAARSALASASAAQAALEVLRSSTSRGVAVVPSAVAGALGARLDAAADAAAAAVAAVTREMDEHPDGEDDLYPSNPSCTFVAAVVDGDVALVGSVGDSRAYWLPDAGEPRRLTTDDSWAEEQVRLGAPREQAEAGPQAHTITRWLGVDAPDHTPAKVPLPLTSPGWLLVCSDGLWNYASEPATLADVVAQVAARPDGSDPLVLARGLVDWANAQGGRDNITVGLARIDVDAPERQVVPPRPDGGELPVDPSATTERIVPGTAPPGGRADAQPEREAPGESTHGRGDGPDGGDSTHA
ncbi:PP2C family protein-serine/threonine phosphatase [Agilicoccus flavus]|uniref:PP2C family protein-serine/threonine phosphatase n=1 Tax=Agilicoccus flavus TaxID=2775968 RepID=UPI001CF6EDD3|nr:PP2C family protein-serine/threonine phosphatase [Agilicoccus flavus]